MNALDEAKDLALNPLPQEELVMQPEDKYLPSRIMEVEKQIEGLQNALILAQEAHKALLDRAVALKVGEDENAIIIRKEKNLPREINTDYLKEKYPMVYDSCINAEVQAARQRIEKQIEKLGETSTIHLKTVQAFMGEQQIDECCHPHRIVVTYEVRSSKLPLPEGKGVKKLQE